ncbi:hypothetical protein EJ04DRAFT_551363 [Polyplosphaeria fusca]|uniref:Uncharacterized protein n=1 Tax=Polyplosphaeria fusca TaxID=682080 RepID=A0A9P4R1B3_9PLEO|nr:hypothetical protein EJ04DRAFT_551363 [Polyplosphaeria fusca]
MRSYDIVQKALVAILVATTYASPAPEPAPAPAPEPHWLDKRSCVGDNCLRALRNRIATATPFCATYTTDAAATIPTWATSQCASNPTKVTSACGCLATTVPSARRFLSFRWQTMLEILAACTFVTSTGHPSSQLWWKLQRTGSAMLSIKEPLDSAVEVANTGQPISEHNES